MPSDMRVAYTQDEITEACQALIDLRDGLDLFIQDNDIKILRKALNMSLDAIGLLPISKEEENKDDNYSTFIRGTD